MKWLICWWYGHRWGHDVRQTEYWWQTEEVGEGGGYYMESHVSPMPGNDPEEYEKVFYTHDCLRCGAEEKIP